MASITLDKALDVVEKLPFEQQQTPVEVVRERLVEKRRDEIARNAKRAQSFPRRKSERWHR